MSARRFLALIAVLSVAVPIVLAAVAWHRSGSASTWTDHQDLRVAAADARTRGVIWGPATPLTGTEGTTVDEYEPTASPAGAALVFVRRRPGSNADIVAMRWTPEGWTEPQPLSAINSDADELNPAFAADGRSLWFASNREGGAGGFDLWLAPADGNGWGPPVNAGPAVNGPFDEYGPAPMPDGTALFFASDRPDSNDEPVSHGRDWTATLREALHRHDHDLYVAVFDESGPRDAHRVEVLSSRFDEGAPAVSPIGDFLYFASDRPGGLGGFDLWRSRLVEGAPGPPERLDATVNSGSNELDPAVASDGFRLYFSSDRRGSGDALSMPTYRLWWSTSREVEYVRGSFLRAWAEAWMALWPWFLLLALLLLLLLTLHGLLRDESLRDRIRRLSLLAKCLLASALVHALIALALAAWTVGHSVSALLGPRGTRVVLAGTSAEEALAGQVLVPSIAAAETQIPLAVAAIEIAPPHPLPAPRPAPVAIVDAPVQRTSLDDRTVDAGSPRSQALAAHVPLATVADLTTERPPLDIALPTRSAPQAADEPEATAPVDTPVPPSSPAPHPALPVELPSMGDTALPTARTVDATVTSAELPPLPLATPVTTPRQTGGAAPRLPAASVPTPPALPPEAEPAPSSTLDTLRAAAATTDSAPAPLAPPIVPALSPSIAPASDLPNAPLPRGSFDDAVAPASLGHAAGLTAAAPAFPRTNPVATTTEARVPEAPSPRETFEQRAAETRGDLVDALGGSVDTERAVRLALDWFQRVQSGDGRWSSRAEEGEAECDAAMTGLALLSFLGAGHTHAAEGPYRETISKGLDWLVRRQRPDGDLRGPSDTMFGQTIGAVALCEAYAMTRDARLASPARRAVDVVVAAAGSGRSGSDRDVAVLGWLIMTIESARRAGFDPPLDVSAAARRWLDSVADPRAPGHYAYRSGDAPSAAMTAEAMFVQQLLGRTRDESRMGQSAELLSATPPQWTREAPTHSWYYTTLALFQHQGEAWRRWNEALAPLLVDVQRKDGRQAGSWDPQDRWSRTCGRIYQTAICTLSLEVYYRYRVR